MTDTERKQAKAMIKLALEYLTDDELKALAALAITRELSDGRPITEA